MLLTVKVTKWTVDRMNEYVALAEW